MIRKDLEALGLEKEAIDKIMDLHKIDTEKHKTDLEVKDSELVSKDVKITELTNSVKQFDGVDVKKLQEDVDAWKVKYENDLGAEKKNHAINMAITEAKPKNRKALMALIDTSIVKLNEDGSVTGLKEQLENEKKENSFLFEEEKEVTNPMATGDTHVTPPSKEAPLTLDGAVNDFYAN